jgi:hypothetical protein
MVTDEPPMIPMDNTRTLARTDCQRRLQRSRLDYIGGPCWDRTSDLPLRRRLLYPLS